MAGEGLLRRLAHGEPERDRRLVPARFLDRRCASNDLGQQQCDCYSDHVTKQMTASEAKTHLLRLLDEAAAGEEIEITKRGRPVARLVSASGGRTLKGSFEGVASTAGAAEQLFSTEASWNAA
jgi:prevent-host-death family protein